MKTFALLFLCLFVVGCGYKPKNTGELYQSDQYAANYRDEALNCEDIAWHAKYEVQRYVEQDQQVLPTIFVPLDPKTVIRIYAL